MIRNLISRSFRIFLDISNFIERHLIAISVLLMALNNISNVIGRTIFNHSLYFSEELNSILIILITFTGMSYAARHALHIRMTAIYDNMPSEVKRVLLIIICIITSIIMFAMAYLSYKYIIDLYPKKRILPALGIEVFWTYLWMPISFFMTGLQYARTCFRNMINDELHLSTRVTGNTYDQFEI